MKKNEKQITTNDDRMKLFSIKAGFVAGVVLLIAIVKDCVELFVAIPWWIVYCYSFVVLIGVSLVLGTKLLDGILHSKKVAQFGEYLTVMSPIIFVLESFIINCPSDKLDMESKIAMIVLVGVMAGGAISFLLSKRKTSKAQQ